MKAKCWKAFIDETWWFATEEALVPPGVFTTTYEIPDDLVARSIAATDAAFAAAAEMHLCSELVAAEIARQSS